MNIVTTFDIDDKVYVITNKDNLKISYHPTYNLFDSPQQRKIVQITISRNGLLYHVKDFSFSENDIGKIVFKTLDEANAALKSLKDENSKIIEKFFDHLEKK